MGGEHDLDQCGQVARPSERADGRRGRPADASGRRREVTLGEPQQRQPRLGIEPPPARRPVQELRLVDVAPEPVELRLFVVGERQLALVRLAFGDAAGLGESGRPGAAELQDLRTVHAARAVEEAELCLRGTPGVEHGRPFAGPVEREHPLAASDDRAVHEPSTEVGQSVCCGDEHGFVEQAHPLGDIAALDEGATCQLPPEGREVGLLETVAYGGCFHRIPVRGLVLAGEKHPMDARHEQVAAHGAVPVPFRDRGGPRQPGLGPAVLTQRRQPEPQPERCARSPQLVARREAGRVAALEESEAHLFVRCERGGFGVQLEIIEAERVRAVLLGEEREGVLPTLLGERDSPGG